MRTGNFFNDRALWWFYYFSAFTLEGIGLLKEERLVLFFSFVIGSMVLGFAFTYIGMRLLK